MPRLFTKYINSHFDFNRRNISTNSKENPRRILSAADSICERLSPLKRFDNFMDSGRVSIFVRVLVVVMLYIGRGTI